MARSRDAAPTRASRGALTLGGLALLAGAALLLAACGDASDDASDGGDDRDSAAAADPASPAPTSAADERASSSTSALVAAPPGATTFQSVVLADGTAIEFAVALPPAFEAEREWPTVLALPPGAQSTAMVEAGLDLYWAAGPPRGWVVISPAAPGGRLFFEGSEEAVGEFLDIVGRTYRPEGGRYHLVGVSNGGISAFRVAAGDPARFRSLLVAPGFPLSYDDVDGLARLVDLPVAMYVGEHDAGWVGPMRDAFGTLSAFGADVTLEVVPGAGHVIRSISGDQLFDVLDSYRQAPSPRVRRPPAPRRGR